MKSEVTRKYLNQITVIALTSRLVILIFQFWFNVVIPNHINDGFISPVNKLIVNPLDIIVVNWLLDGIIHWDAQHFIHISYYGYVYEHSLAFFPGYPICIIIVSSILEKLFWIFNRVSIISMSAIFINLVFFILSARVLFLLTVKEFKNEKLAYLTSFLFCLNPASIFFSAPYSESLFSYLTFNAMLQKNFFYSSMFVSLSAIVRFNGIFNLGFPLYREFKNFWLVNNKNISHCLYFICKVVTICFLSSCLFIAYQIYSYFLFCYDFKEIYPDEIVKQALFNAYIIKGNFSTSMCNNYFVFPYFYIQNHYWRVGFLEYYTFKQIPNFILAIPVIYFISTRTLKYCTQNKMLVFSLGLESPARISDYNFTFEYVIHSTFLFFVCLFFSHIQIITRLMCASTPVLFWFAAIEIHIKKRSNRTFPKNNFFNEPVSCYIIYCGLYFIIGTILFSNGYPWT